MSRYRGGKRGAGAEGHPDGTASFLGAEKLRLQSQRGYASRDGESNTVELNNVSTDVGGREGTFGNNFLLQEPRQIFAKSMDSIRSFLYPAVLNGTRQLPPTLRSFYGVTPSPT
ncbi:hypothetical protein KM043_015821 [Ampulex compressa]|nr:hypothetical protein KM043_015821 [Ampulex compressa]